LQTRERYKLQRCALYTRLRTRHFETEKSCSGKGNTRSAPVLKEFHLQRFVRCNMPQYTRHETVVYTVSQKRVPS